MPDSREPAIEIRDVHKYFGDFCALSGITSTILRGRITGILGPSGSGKTTLIRIMAGVMVASRGEVRVLGRVMPDRDRAREIGYMTQRSALYQDLTVRENVAFYAAMCGVRQRSAIDRALERVDLTHRAGRQAYTLSGGERQRASLAIALVHDPKILLLDEPTVGTDPRLRARLWDDFRGRADAGVGVFVSSHMMEEMERCDHLLLISEGRLLAEGPPGEIRERAGNDDLEGAFLTLTEARE